MDSTSKCTTKSVLNHFERCSIAEALARPIIERVNNESKIVLGVNKREARLAVGHELQKATNAIASPQSVGGLNPAHFRKNDQSQFFRSTPILISSVFLSPSTNADLTKPTRSIYAFSSSETYILAFEEAT